MFIYNARHFSQDVSYWFKEGREIYQKLGDKTGLDDTFDTALEIARKDLKNARPWLETGIELTTSDDNYVLSDNPKVSQLAKLMLEMRIERGDVRATDASKLLDYLREETPDDSVVSASDVISTLSYLQQAVRRERTAYFMQHLPEFLESLGYRPIGQIKSNISRLQHAIRKGVVPFTQNDYALPSDNEFHVVRIEGNDSNNYDVSEISIYVLSKTRVGRLVDTQGSRNIVRARSNVNPQYSGENALLQLTARAESIGLL